ncbi:hypothetical protein TanjilG_32754 [Lupinus angustifolius]|uniref:F-box associated beta-propeller type 3 domain-containing protein n=1 Tax=Lupinus angustifolius TaxID=3871 RepID=A0A4P1RG02_LUPAN|nr:hypothetical protein TanjilG_32754 [Lupinus angustifolius]
MSTRKRQHSIIKPPCQNVAPPSVLSPLLVEELIVDIMSMLPVKSLNQFTYVAKQWNIFLSSSYFIRLSDPLLSIIDNPSPYPTLFGRILSPYLRYPSGVDSYNLFGFGYNHIHDSYKTVAINSDPKGDIIDKKALVKVYELGVPTTWRKIQSFPYVHKKYGFSNEPCGVFIKGTLNWLCTRPNDSLVVVSVDLVNDTCKEVLLPGFVDTNRYGAVVRPNLWVLEGCLCFSYENHRTHFVLWQMKVYGDASSWNVLFSISYKVIGIHRNIPNYPKPLLMLNNGDFLIQITESGGFLLYNPMHNSFKYFEFQSGMSLFESIVHIDNLVSPCPTRLHRIRGLPCLYTFT